MAGTYPNLGSGKIAMYPVQKDFTIPTRVTRFLNDTEQRWVSGSIRNAWVIQNSHIKYTDVTALQSFFNTQKGSFDTTWTFPFEGTSYTNCSFDQDDFSYQEVGFNKFSVTLNFRQVIQSGSYSSVASLVYPIIHPAGQTAPSTVVVQYPFTSAPAYLTTKNEMESGLKYTYAWRASALWAWNITYTSITDSEVATLQDFYIAAVGQYKTFSFVDPNSGVNHSKCRFLNKTFTRTYKQNNQSAVNLALVEVA